MKWLNILGTMVLLLACAELSWSQDDAAAEEDEPLKLEGLFNCNRGQQECKNNGTCGEEDGLCVCEEGFSSYDCGVNGTASAELTCEPPCENEGYCVEEEDGLVCSCTEMYTGETCADFRFNHVCSPDSMEIFISPIVNVDEEFTGLIYITDGKLDDDSCSLLLSADAPGMYSAEIPFDSCGNASSAVSDTGDEERAFNITVQYIEKYITSLDQEFMFKCILKAPDSELDFGESEVSSDPNNKGFKNQPIEAELLPIDITITDEEGNPLQGAEVIGTPLSINYKLNAGDVYDSFTVMELTATNGLEGDDAESILFIQDGCVTKEAAPLVKDFSGDPTDETNLVFNLFKFVKSYKILFQNIVKMCKETGNCNATECDSSEFLKLGRRKRDIIVVDDDEILKNYTNTVHIAPTSRVNNVPVEPYNNRVERTQPNIRTVPQFQAGVAYEPTIAECMQSMAFLIITLVLIVLVLISVAICAACCVRFIHARPHHQNKA